MSIEISGVKDTLRQLGATEKEIENALSAALYQEGLALDAEAVMEVPVDQGFLKGSHYTAPPTGLGDPVVETGFGKDYAADVHERDEIRHKVGNAKFLERPMRRRQTNYLPRLAARTKENWERKISVSAIPTNTPRRPNNNRIQ